MKKLEWALLLGMVGAVCCSALTGTAQSYRSLEQNVLRLHILANSDSIDDQALKLKVRDKVLEQADTLFAGDAESVEDAETIAAENLETLEQTAQQLVWDEGYSYPVKAQLVEMPFDDRTYGDWVRPAHHYRCGTGSELVVRDVPVSVCPQCLRCHRRRRDRRGRFRKAGAGSAAAS